MAPQLQSLPDLVFRTLADHLPAQDLFTLRLTCRQISQQTYKDFSRLFRTGDKLAISGLDDTTSFKRSLRGYNVLLEDNPDIASTIKSLTVRFTADRYGVRPVRSTTLVSILSKLPNLDRLEITTEGNLKIGDYLDPGVLQTTMSENYKLHRLILDLCSATPLEISALVQIFRPRCLGISGPFGECCQDPSYWVALLPVLRGLDGLKFFIVWHMLVPGMSTIERYETHAEHGRSRCIITKRSASIVGPVAIKAGLDFIQRKIELWI